MGTIKLQEVVKAGKGAPLMMFQLYVLADRGFMKTLIQGRSHHRFCTPTIDIYYLKLRHIGLRTSLVTFVRTLLDIYSMAQRTVKVSFQTSSNKQALNE